MTLLSSFIDFKSDKWLISDFFVVIFCLICQTCFVWEEVLIVSDLDAFSFLSHLFNPNQNEKFKVSQRHDLWSF